MRAPDAASRIADYLIRESKAGEDCRRKLGKLARWATGLPDGRDQ